MPKHKITKSKLFKREKLSRIATQDDIEEIFAHRLNADEWTKDNMSEACARCSEMSQDSRQFIYEMVQNVDDTPHSIHSAELTLALMQYNPLDGNQLSDPILLILSKQDGFIRKDVEGICNIGNGRNKEQYKGGSKHQADSESSMSTGEKGVGFKSVFSVSTEPMMISTHVKASDPILFSIPGFAKGFRNQSLPEEDEDVDDENRNDDIDDGTEEEEEEEGEEEEETLTIPFMTPIPLSVDKVELMKSMLDEVNKFYPTSVSYNSGTMLGVPLDKGDWNSIASILRGGDSSDLSDLDFVFLRKIEKIGLFVFEKPGQQIGRVLSFLKESNATTTSPMILKTKVFSSSHPPVTSVTNWIIHVDQIPLEKSRSNRRRTVQLCRPLDMGAFELLHQQGTRVYTTLPTYNEPDAQPGLASQSYLLNAHFTLNTARTAVSVNDEWNADLINFIGQEMLPKVIEFALREDPDWSIVYYLVPDVPGIYPIFFCNSYQNTIRALDGVRIIKVVSESETLVVSRDCILPPSTSKNIEVYQLLSIQQSNDDKKFIPHELHKLSRQIPHPCVLTTSKVRSVLKLLGVREWNPILDFQQAIIDMNNECAEAYWALQRPDQWFTILFNYTCSEEIMQLMWYGDLSEHLRIHVDKLFKHALQTMPYCYLKTLDAISKSVTRSHHHKNLSGVRLDLSPLCFTAVNFLETNPEEWQWWQSDNVDELNRKFKHLLTVLGTSFKVLGSKDAFSSIWQKCCDILCSQIMKINVNMFWEIDPNRFDWWKSLCKTVVTTAFMPSPCTNQLCQSLLSLLMGIDDWWKKVYDDEDDEEDEDDIDDEEEEDDDDDGDDTKDISHNLDCIVDFIDFIEIIFPESTKLDFFVNPIILEKIFLSLDINSIWSSNNPQILLCNILGKCFEVNQRSKNLSKEFTKVIKLVKLEKLKIILMKKVLDDYDLERGIAFAECVTDILSILVSYGLMMPCLTNLSELMLKAFQFESESFLIILKTITKFLATKNVRAKYFDNDFSILLIHVFKFIESDDYLSNENICWWKQQSIVNSFSDTLLTLIDFFLISFLDKTKKEELFHQLGQLFVGNCGIPNIQLPFQRAWWNGLCQAVFNNTVPTTSSDQHCLSDIQVKQIQSTLFQSLLSLLHKSIPAETWWKGTEGGGKGICHGICELGKILEMVDKVAKVAEEGKTFFFEGSFMKQILSTLDVDLFWKPDDDGLDDLNRLSNLLGVFHINVRIYEMYGANLADKTKILVNKLITWYQDFIQNLVERAPLNEWWMNSKTVRFESVLKVLNSYQLLSISKKVIPLLGPSDSIDVCLSPTYDTDLFLLPTNAEFKDVKLLIDPTPVLRIVHPNLAEFFKDIDLRQVQIEQLSKEKMLEKVCEVMRRLTESAEKAKNLSDKIANDAIRFSQKIKEDALGDIQVMRENNKLLKKKVEDKDSLIANMSAAHQQVLEENERLRALVRNGEHALPPALPMSVVAPDVAPPQPPPLSFANWIGPQPALQQAMMAIVGGGGNQGAMTNQAQVQAAAVAEAERLLRSNSIRRLRTRTTLGIVSRGAGTINLGFTVGVTEIDELITSYF